MNYDEALTVATQIFTLAFAGAVYIILLGIILKIVEKGRLYHLHKHLDTIVSAGCSGIATTIINFIDKLSTQENIIVYITIYGITLLYLSLHTLKTRQT